MKSGFAGSLRCRPTCQSGTWNSIVPRFAAQANVGRSLTIAYGIAACPSFDGTVTEQTHSGACDGMCFSKKNLPSTPSGNRFIVNGRSLMCGSMTSAIRT